MESRDGNWIYLCTKIRMTTKSRRWFRKWNFLGASQKRQKLPTLPEGANGAYAGSPIQMNFGETEDRGVYILKFKNDGGWKYSGKKYVRIDNRGFIPLVTVKSQDQLDDLPEEIWQLCPEPQPGYQGRTVVEIARAPVEALIDSGASFSLSLIHI